MHILRRLARILAVELVIYGILVTGYFLAVLRFLTVPLTNLFHHNIDIYAVSALALIAGQGIVLDLVTTFLVDRLNLRQFDED